MKKTIKNPEKFEVAKNLIEIKATKSGYVKSIDALAIGLASCKLGGGRETMDDIIDFSAGIMLSKKVGDTVNTGETLCVLHTNKDASVYEAIAKEALEAFEIVNVFVPKEPVIKEVIR